MPPLAPEGVPPPKRRGTSRPVIENIDVPIIFRQQINSSFIKKTKRGDQL